MVEGGPSEQVGATAPRAQPTALPARWTHAGLPDAVPAYSVSPGVTEMFGQLLQAVALLALKLGSVEQREEEKVESFRAAKESYDTFREEAFSKLDGVRQRGQKVEHDLSSHAARWTHAALPDAVPVYNMLTCTHAR